MGVTCSMHEIKYSYKIFRENRTGRDHLGDRLKRRQKANIKMDLQKQRVTM
jgi:hypothetical protein